MAIMIMAAVTVATIALTDIDTSQINKQRRFLSIIRVLTIYIHVLFHSTLIHIIKEQKTGSGSRISASFNKCK